MLVAASVLAAGTLGASASPRAVAPTLVTAGKGGFGDLTFTPATVKIKLGTSVKWHFQTGGHTTTDRSFGAITWATAAIPSGYAVDVQRKGPAGAYATILTHTTTLSATQTLARGTYNYRARLVRLSGGATKFSPAATITVS